MKVERTHLIVHVRDQSASTAFYREVLDREPVLEVPGMTEFALGDAVILGLMPEAGFAGCSPSSPRPRTGWFVRNCT